MRILVFSEYYFPERFLLNQITEELCRRGHEVTVLTGKPNYNFPGGKVPKEYKKIDFEQINGVKVYRCNVLGRGTNKIRQVLNYVSYAKNADKLADMLGNEYDIVYCYQVTPAMQLKPAIKFARKHHLPLVCYCLDPAPLCGIGQLKYFPYLKKRYVAQAKKYYNSCDRILVTSKSFIQYHKDVNEVPEEKMKYLPQHAPDYDCSSESTHTIIGKYTFMFAGNLGIGPRLENVIQAVSKLSGIEKKDFSVVFVGEGSEKQRLLKLTADLGLENHISFEDGVPIDAMKKKYEKADALIVTLRKGQITVPGKMQAYMSTGKPILGAMDGSGKDLIEKVDCGICVAPENPEEIAYAMKLFIDDPEKYRQKGLNGKRFYKKNCTLAAHVEHLISELNEVINN